LLSIVLLCTVSWPIFAEDCEKISDDNAKATCYGEKVEKKEEEKGEVIGEIEEIRKKSSELSEEISDLAAQSSITQSEIDQLQTKIDGLRIQIDELNKNLEDRRKTMSQKETLRNTALRNLSKKSLLTEWEKFIGSSNDLSSLSGFEYATFTYIFDRALSKDALNWIKVLNDEILGFEANKAEAHSLKDEIAQAQTNLIGLKNQMDNQRAEAEEVKGALAEEEKEKIYSQNAGKIFPAINDKNQ